MELAASYLVAGGRVFWVDGGNSFNPYRLTEAAKRLGMDPAPLLRRLFVARAFTVYQLEALIRRRLKPSLERYPDALGVIYDPLALFMDGEVGEVIVLRVLRQITSEIKGLKARGYRLIVLCPDRGLKIQSRDNLFNILGKTATRIITLPSSDRLLIEKNDKKKVEGGG